MKLRGLYAITDSELLAGKFLSYVEAALEGGVTLLQYRDKSNDEARRLREAEALRDLCERYKTQLIINDDAELAARLGVGVHLGQTDGPLSPTRALLGRKRSSVRPATRSSSWPNKPPKKARVTSPSVASSIPTPSPARRPAASICSTRPNARCTCRSARLAASPSTTPRRWWPTGSTCSPWCTVCSVPRAPPK
jgi:hypothetical protein